MPILPILGAIAAWLAEHYDLVALLYDAITQGKLTKAQATEAINKAIVAASDAEMAREFPQGGQP